MDSLTQIVLGASVAELTLGKKIGNRAVLWGAIAGTIPDLDTLTSFMVDDITANEWHRGFTHSIFFCLIASPLFAWIMHKSEKLFLSIFLSVIFLLFILAFWEGNSRISFALIAILFAVLFLVFKFFKDKNKEATKGDWTKLFFWCLLTHPLLDCHTSWGTQLLWPLPYKFAWNNIFVADFFYTLPFLACVAIFMFYKRNSPKRRMWNRIGLIVSSTYMILTLIFKWLTFNQFEQALIKQKIEYRKMSTRPTPFNTILWTANVESEDAYYMGFRSILDKTDQVEFVRIEKNHHWIDHLMHEEDIHRLIKLSQNEWAITQTDTCWLFNDLRFGQMEGPSTDGEFVFSYAIKETPEGLNIQALDPGLRRNEDGEAMKDQMSKGIRDIIKRAKGI